LITKLYIYIFTNKNIANNIAECMQMYIRINKFFRIQATILNL